MKANRNPQLKNDREMKIAANRNPQLKNDREMKIAAENRNPELKKNDAKIKNSVVNYNQKKYGKMKIAVNPTKKKTKKTTVS